MHEFFEALVKLGLVGDDLEGWVKTEAELKKKFLAENILRANGNIINGATQDLTLGGVE